MAVTAGDIIEGARDQHPSFDERRHPGRMLLRVLSGYHRDLCIKAVHQNEAILASSQTTLLPLAVFATGIALPAYQYLHGGTVVPVATGSDPAPLTIVPWANRFQAARFPAGYVLGATLFLLGAATDWTPYASIVLSYTPIAGELTASNSVLLLPDTAAATCEAALALVMANRGTADPGMPPINVGRFAQLADEAERTFLDDIFLRRGNQTNLVREVRNFA
jgi:hypothetical protein